ncbi:MAG: hypothetical protein ACR2NN_21200, partial [Bryobacteraceae bacterium]
GFKKETRLTVLSTSPNPVFMGPCQHPGNALLEMLPTDSSDEAESKTTGKRPSKPRSKPYMTFRQAFDPNAK